MWFVQLASAILLACALFCSATAVPATVGWSAKSHEDGLATDPDLTLGAVVFRTFERHPNSTVLDVRAQEAEALTGQAKSLLAGAPALTLRYQTDELGDRDGLQEWETGVELPLWLIGQRDARRAVAEQVYAELPLAQKALLLELAGQVREAVWEVEQARNRYALAEQEWRTARRLEQDVQKRVRLGEMAKLDLILAQDETLTRRGDLVHAETELKHAQRAYRVLTGLQRLPGQPAETQSDRATIEDDHPLLARADADVQRIMAERDVARVERRANPTLTLGTRHERALSDDPFADSVGVIFRLPLGSKAHAAPGMAAAEVALAQAHSRRELLRRELELALHEAMHNIEVGNEDLDGAERRNQLAQENLRLTRIAFAAGETDLVSVLRIQVRAFAAERNLRLRRLQLQRETSRYNQAVGVLP